MHTCYAMVKRKETWNKFSAGQQLNLVSMWWCVRVVANGSFTLHLQRVWQQGLTEQEYCSCSYISVSNHCSLLSASALS